MLGIIGAMDIEVSSLREKLTEVETAKISGLEFSKGRLNSYETVIALCGAGKINAAACTQIMIDKYKPEEIINIGVGCSLSEDVVIGDIVVADDVCQYDVDLSPLGSKRGQLDGFEQVKIKTSDVLSSKLSAAAKTMGYKIHHGTIASGDLFIASSDLKKDIAQNFGAICGEMEGGAIGQVCFINNIPFSVIRSISDGGDEEANITFREFCKKVAEKTTAVILKITE